MAKMEERLQMIGSAILTQAERESKEIIASANEIRSREMSVFEEEIVRSMFHHVQKEAGNIRQEATRSLADAQLKAHRQLLRRREELTATVFASAKTRLFEYVSTPEYRENLLRELGNLPGGAKAGGCVLYLREADLDLEKEILRILPGCTVQADAGIRIGGWRLLDPSAGTLVDESLDARLEEQRPWFLSHCGMRVVD